MGENILHVYLSSQILCDYYFLRLMSYYVLCPHIGVTVERGLHQGWSSAPVTEKLNLDNFCQVTISKLVIKSNC